ncbi:MAG: DUF5615 family PIN-like protein [Pirellula sp.]
MRFKIDENLPTEGAQLLRDAGYDALTIHDQFMVGKPDSVVSSVYRLDRIVSRTFLYCKKPFWMNRQK